MPLELLIGCRRLPFTEGGRHRAGPVYSGIRYRLLCGEIRSNDLRAPLDVSHKNSMLHELMLLLSFKRQSELHIDGGTQLE